MWGLAEKHQLPSCPSAGAAEIAPAASVSNCIANSCPSGGRSVLPATAREFRRPSYISLNARNETPGLN